MTGCFDGSPAVEGTDAHDAAGSSSSGPVVADVTGMPSEPGTTGTPNPTSTSISDSTGPLDESGESSTGAPGCGPDCPEHPLDVIFVVDNTPTMGLGQLRLASAVEGLMDQLAVLEAQRGVQLDLHVMVTTTDFGNPLCTPFAPMGYEPAQGAPISTACTDRLADFTGLGGAPVYTEACTEVCPLGVAPTDPFVAVQGAEDNVPGGSARQALQCLVPQGLNGCGYEAPLESMLQALNPFAEWNTAPNPFLRDGADLVVVLLTDEMDCSILDYSIMEDPSLMNSNPGTGLPAPSSAICWNAGVSCDGPDELGAYENCEPLVGEGLQPTTRYIDYLLDELARSQGKEVAMLALTGIPSVTMHAGRPPYEPVAGGVDQLVFREWVDGPFPAGDIIPDEWAAGVRAGDKTFELGIGPGCTGFDAAGYVQGQPPSRIREVCESLDGQGGTHCCMESICDGNYGGAMTCMRGLVETML